MKDLYVNLGCGLTTPPGWLNVNNGIYYYIRDLPVVGRGLYRVLAWSRGWKLPANVRYCDLARPLRIPDDSCKGVYCSHVLGYLGLEEARSALVSIYRILQPNGLFRIVVPNVRTFINEYLEDTAADALHRFMKDTYLGQERQRGKLSQRIIDWLLEVNDKTYLWMWDQKSLEMELRQAGFASVRIAHYGDSEDPHFREVEDPGRWNHHAVGFECTKQQ
jgi:predicted SAM-dependent methyltransferase